MQVENLTKEQFIRDFKDTLHHEQLIKVAKATPTEIFTALAGLIRKYYTNTWIERNHALSDNQEKIAYYFLIFNTLLTEGSIQIRGNWKFSSNFQTLPIKIRNRYFKIFIYKTVKTVRFIITRLELVFYSDF